MPCVKVLSLAGREREICDGKVMPMMTKTPDGFYALDKQIGSGAGDWIKTFAAPIAKSLGMKDCSGCEARRLTGNAYSQLMAKYGAVKTIKIMSDLVELSFSDPDRVVENLRGYLDEADSSHTV